MTNKIRILSVIIALLTLLSVFCLSVNATDEVVPPVVDPPVVDPPVVDPPVVDPPVVDPPVVDPPVVDPPVVDPDPGTDQPDDPNPGTGTDTPVDPNPGTVNPPTGGYVTDDNGFYYYDEDTMANSIENSAGSVSNATKQYDTSDINEAALKQTKWNDITLDTSKPAANAMDFSSIKDNTRNNDDGQWILYSGFMLIGLSVVGIIYFIIATTTYKKKLAKAGYAYQQYGQERTRDDYGDYGYESDYTPQPQYSSRPHRKRYAADGMSYAERKRMKADTAEINLPDNYNARH